ncbi:MAG: acyl-CoA dehydratase activase [Candidatus Hydrogenedentota bacterium]
MPGPWFAGVDVGSATTKCVLIDEAGCVLTQVVLPSGGKLTAAADRAIAQAIGEAGGTPDNIAALVSTGYGRENVKNRTKAVTEITCHARGAHTVFPEARSVIDIGGQDSKAIAIEPDGRVRRFEMNDKCAAGTGRFLDVMARTLEIDLKDIGPTALTAEKPAHISSTCTVFAESEVISLLAQDMAIPEILAGLCEAIAQRVNSLATRVGMHPEVMMTGGVAKNAGVVKAIETKVGHPITVPPEPQTIGALGAALFARDLAKKQAEKINH